MKAIITALNAAYNECGYVQKQRTAGLNYSYAGESALIEAIRPILIKHGITVHQSGCDVVKAEEYTTTKGGKMNRIIAVFTFNFSHVSGESIMVSALGEGADSGDKAAPKANTSALKYALRQTLLIETGDDPDATSSDAQTRAAGPTKEEVLGWIAKAPNQQALESVWQDILAVGMQKNEEVRAAWGARDEALSG